MLNIISACYTVNRQKTERMPSGNHIAEAVRRKVDTAHYPGNTTLDLTRDESEIAEKISDILIQKADEVSSLKYGDRIMITGEEKGKGWGLKSGIRNLEIVYQASKFDTTYGYDLISLDGYRNLQVNNNPDPSKELIRNSHIIDAVLRSYDTSARISIPTLTVEESIIAEKISTFFTECGDEILSLILNKKFKEQKEITDGEKNSIGWTLIFMENMLHITGPEPSVCDKTCLMSVRQFIEQQIKNNPAFLKGKNLSNFHCMKFCNLSGADLTGTCFDGSYLTGVDLTGANLSDATLMGSSLDQARLIGVKLSRLTWVDPRTTFYGTSVSISFCPGPDGKKTDIPISFIDFIRTEFTPLKIDLMRQVITHLIAVSDYHSLAYILRPLDEIPMSELYVETMSAVEGAIQTHFAKGEYKKVAQVLDTFNNKKFREVFKSEMMTLLENKKYEQAAIASQELKSHIEHIDLPSEAQFLLRGLTHFKNKEYKKALVEFKLTTDYYDEVQYRLGLMYMRGLGVEQDDEKAIFHLKNPAHHAHIDAAFMLGKFYWRCSWRYRIEDVASALLKKALDANHPKAAYEIGMLLIKQKKEEEDIVSYLMMAHKQYNHPDAAYKLAKWYENRSIFSNQYERAQAKRYFTIAAQAGNVKAQKKLGDFPVTNEEAVNEYCRAAMARGESEKVYKYNLGMLFLDGENGYRQSFTNARKYLLEAYVLVKDAPSDAIFATLTAFNIAQSYRNAGVLSGRQDDVQAEHWYRIAAQGTGESANKAIKILNEHYSSFKWESVANVFFSSQNEVKKIENQYDDKNL